MEAGTRLVVPPREVRTRRSVGVPGDWLTPPRVRPGALLYLHGGGYVVGSARSHRALAGRLAAAVGIAALVLDYRLAPEHPHPAALQDALAAYRSLLAEGVPPKRIAIVGDSAGGGLALSLAMSLRDGGLPLPAVLGVICPWLDLTPDLERRRAPAAREPVLTPGLLTAWATAYAQGHDARMPAISPLLGEYGGLPPLVLHSASDDPLGDDAERLEAGAAEHDASWEVEHRRHAGVWHDFHLFHGLLAEADEAVDALAASLGRRLAPGH